jgi:DNA-binding NarL/FixJ family response regulator
MADIVIVDDHPIVCEGLSRLIKHKSNGKLNVVGLADNEEDALRIVTELKPDLVIVDVFLKGFNGVELVKQIKELYPDMKILMLSMHDEFLYAERAINAGADGYIMKQESSDDITKAIEKVLDGQTYVSERMSAMLLRKKARGCADKALPASLLTERELEVFQMLGTGWTTRRIAEELNLSIKTVETYSTRIKEKLGLNNSNELIHQAVQWVTSKDWI